MKIHLKTVDARIQGWNVFLAVILLCRLTVQWPTRVLRALLVHTWSIPRQLHKNSLSKENITQSDPAPAYTLPLYNEITKMKLRLKFTTGEFHWKSYVEDNCTSRWFLRNANIQLTFSYYQFGTEWSCTLIEVLSMLTDAQVVCPGMSHLSHLFRNTDYSSLNQWCL